MFPVGIRDTDRKQSILAIAFCEPWMSTYLTPEFCIYRVKF